MINLRQIQQHTTRLHTNRACSDSEQCLLEFKLCQFKPVSNVLSYFAQNLNSLHHRWSVREYSASVFSPYKQVEIVEYQHCPAVMLSETSVVENTCLVMAYVVNI